MKFSKERQKELEMKLLALFAKMVLESIKSGQSEESLMDEAFFKRVFDEHMVTGDKQLFLLGALAQKVHDLAPRAMYKTMIKTGIIKDEKKTN